MKIIIGSKNPTKINAVRQVFLTADEIISLDVASHVAEQPFSDVETRRGAINRAKQCAESSSNAIGIGLEGGVMYVENQLFLCNWGALVTAENNVFTASGARVLLPLEVVAKLEKGAELGELMDDYAKKREVRNNEGAIGILTNDLMSRKDMFVHVVTLLKGQWEYRKSM